MSADELSTDGMVIVDTRNIALPQGGVLQVEMTQPFVDKLRQHFGLLVEQPREDVHMGSG